MDKLILLYTLALGPCLLQPPGNEGPAESVATSDHVEKDTLDWRSYYPLEVGNVWEYEVAGGPPLWRREIVGDTTVGRWRYFVFLEFNHPVRPGYTFAYSRYDTLPQVVTFADIDADTIPVPLRFDLSAHFGDTIVFHDDRGEELTFTVEGGYGGTVLGSPVAATKCFVDRYDQPRCYASGVGPTDSGTLDRVELTYAKTGFGEFGTQRYVSVEPSTPPAPGLSILNLYPTPAMDAVNLHVGGATGFSLSVQVYDVLGRVAYAAVRPVGVHGEVEHRADLTDLAPGYYVIKVVDEVGKSVSRPLVVVRPH